MKIVFKAGELKQSKAQAICAFFFAGEEKKIKSLDAVTNGAASKSISAKTFSGKTGEMAAFDSSRFDKVFAAGLGARKDFAVDGARKACGAVAAAAQSRGVKSLAVEMPEGNAEKISRALVEGAILAAYSFDKYKAKEEGAPERKLEEIIIAGSQRDEKEIEKGIRIGGVIAEAANFARAVCNEPPNVATPEFLAQEALRLQGGGLKVTVFDKKALQKMGANAILAVNSGSCKEPRMVVMEWNSSKKGGTVFVGKGITFDSGGISIKPPQNMDKMKFDKSGACAVLGIMKAVKELGYQHRVVGIFAATENLLGSGAYKPSDIVRALNGKTIEILNTDAEGRVLLADALSYASKLGADRIIDYATLTGACVVALGDLCSGLMANDGKLSEKLRRAGEESGERLWPLPTWLEYDEKVKSDYADVKNIGEAGSAGTIAGYSFLKLFVGENKFAHIDIAGTADIAKPKPHLALGATGVGVRLGIEFLLENQ